MSLGDAPRRYFEGESPPPEPYAEHVLALWTFDVSLPAGGSALHTIWPDGCVSLSVVAKEGLPVAASIIGPRMRALRVPMRSGLVMRGIRLWPDTAAHVLGVDPVAIRDLTHPAAELLGVSALSLARGVARADETTLTMVWEEWLEPRIASAALPDPSVRLVVRLLIDSDGTHDIAAAAATAEISGRRLERDFGAAVGLSPKQFARLRRVRAAIAAIEAGERDVGTLATRSGHDDATRFAREFKSVTGLAPVVLMDQLDELEATQPEQVS